MKGEPIGRRRTKRKEKDIKERGGTEGERIALRREEDQKEKARLRQDSQNTVQASTLQLVWILAKLCLQNREKIVLQ